MFRNIKYQSTIPGLLCVNDAGEWKNLHHFCNTLSPYITCRTTQMEKMLGDSYTPQVVHTKKVKPKYASRTFNIIFGYWWFTKQSSSVNQICFSSLVSFPHTLPKKIITSILYQTKNGGLKIARCKSCGLSFFKEKNIESETNRCPFCNSERIANK